MKKSKKKNNNKDKVITKIVNWIVISDLHFGCQAGLCPPDGVQLDEGGYYRPSEEQLKIWEHWVEFWDEWVPRVTKKQPYGVIINGDTIDGVHHNATHQISHNLSDQADIALSALRPVVNKAKGNFYMIRGTEAHGGPSAVEEERLAKALGAVPDPAGRYARYDLWKRVGNGLVHFLHHIGTTSSNAYEATALNKELTEEFNEAARWREEPPDIIVRSHRHRFIKITISSRMGEAIGVVTPGWQAKTPFTYKLAGARLAPPQFGGVLIRHGDEELFTRHITWAADRTPVE